MTRYWLTPAFALVLALGAASCGSYDPCGGKECGDPCQICDEGDNECVEPAGQKTCNSRSVCTTAGPPVCS